MPGYAGRAVRSYRFLRDEQSSSSLTSVSDLGSKKQAKMRNADVSPPSLQQPSSARGFLWAVSTCQGRRARGAGTARSGVPTKRGRAIKMGIGGKLGDLADPRLGPMPSDHAPQWHSPIGAGRRRPHAARPSVHRYFSVDLRREIRSNTGDSIRSLCAGRQAATTGAMVLRGRLAGRPSAMNQEGEGIADRGACTSIPSALLSGSTR